MKRSKQPKPSPKIDVDADGIRLSGVATISHHQTFDWASVERAVAFKRDLLIRDIICLALQIGSDETIELNEEMEGWQEFCKAVERNLEGSIPPNEWKVRVMRPPFETCALTVYERFKSSSGQ